MRRAYAIIVPDLSERLSETLPQAIETEKQYEQIGARLGELIGKGRSRTPEETKLMRLLAILVEDYDRKNALPPDDSTAAAKLSVPDGSLGNDACLGRGGP
jgi:hypothetical protein